MSAADAVCWCASDVKCPHGISVKITSPGIWDEMEQCIDDVLFQFDRKTIRTFLKRDIDGNNKEGNLKKSTAEYKKTYSAPVSNLTAKNVKKVTGKDSRPGTAPDGYGGSSLSNNSVSK